MRRVPQVIPAEAELFGNWAAEEVNRARAVWAERTGNPNHDAQHTTRDWLTIAIKYLALALYHAAWGRADECQTVMQKAAAMIFEAWAWPFTQRD